MENGLEGKYVRKENKKLRLGYTTGSCAAAAAKAAAKMLLTGAPVEKVELLTPKGILLHLQPVETVRSAQTVSCAVQKEAGDDPDVTDGLLIFAAAQKCTRQSAWEAAKVFLPDQRPPGTDEAVIGIRGGEGVGTVTLPGLEQPVGAPAINRIPRKMITEEVQEVCREAGYTGGIQITIRVPGGARTAERTFNPRLGIQGGISILGTSGIVEPMSERALTASIELEMRQKAASSRYLLVTPGNYGAQYLNAHFPFSLADAVKCSNFVGQTIDFAVNMELEGLLFVAHIGKFVKVAGGIMNTHSKEADARTEILAACALRAGADAKTARSVLNCVTTEEALKVLRRSSVWEETCLLLMDKIQFYLNHRSGGGMKIGAIVFSNVFGELGRTAQAGQLLELLQTEHKTGGLR